MGRCRSSIETTPWVIVQNIVAKPQTERHREAAPGRVEEATEKVIIAHAPASGDKADQRAAWLPRESRSRLGH